MEMTRLPSGAGNGDQRLAGFDIAAHEEGGGDGLQGGGIEAAAGGRAD